MVNSGDDGDAVNTGGNGGGTRLSTCAFLSAGLTSSDDGGGATNSGGDVIFSGGGSTVNTGDDGGGTRLSTCASSGAGLTEHSCSAIQLSSCRLTGSENGATRHRGAWRRSAFGLGPTRWQCGHHLSPHF